MPPRACQGTHRHGLFVHALEGDSPPVPVYKHITDHLQIKCASMHQPSAIEQARKHTVQHQVQAQQHGSLSLESVMSLASASTKDIREQR
jgi:hypothetical protein